MRLELFDKGMSNLRLPDVVYFSSFIFSFRVWNKKYFPLWEIPKPLNQFVMDGGIKELG